MKKNNYRNNKGVMLFSLILLGILVLKKGFSILVQPVLELIPLFIFIRMKTAAKTSPNKPLS